MRSEHFLKRLSRRLGLDRAVAYTVLLRVWNGLAGLVTLYAIVRFLGLDEQGFYYTFSSILGIQIFFELGFSATVMQCVSHERAHLTWTDYGTLDGPARHKERLAALLQITVKCYAVIAILSFLTILPAGIIFFRPAASAHPSVFWRIPWIWVTISESLMLFVSPFFVFLEGAGLVARVAYIRLVTSVATSVALWLTLWRGWALMASPIVSTVGCACSSVLIVIWHRKYFADLWRAKVPPKILNWWTEVWPFQWKVTITWLGYFITQLANPVLFHYQGTKAAGQMGLSTSIVLAIQAVGLAWISTKAPQFGFYVARRQYEELDRLFFKTVKQVLPLLASTTCAVVLCIQFLNATNSPYRTRILAPLPFLALTGKMLTDLGIYFMAVYSRAHKQEPFMVLSLVTAVAIAVSTYVFGRFVGVTALVTANFSVALLSLIPALIIFAQMRRVWHVADSSAELTTVGSMLP